MCKKKTYRKYMTFHAKESKNRAINSYVNACKKTDEQINFFYKYKSVIYDNTFATKIKTCKK